MIPPAGPFPHLTTAVDITNALTVGDPPLPSCQTSVSRSIWYTFTPATTGSYTISSCQTEAPDSNLPDIVLAIYTGASCAGPFTQLAGVAGCDDDSCTTLALQAIISNTTLTAGTQYFILAHKFGAGAPVAPANAIQMRVQLNGAPTPTPTPGPATPTPCGGANVIADGTFEAGAPWTAWTTQTSTNFGTPNCDAGCGTGGGTAGGFGGSANWAWFGGTASAETATAGQTVVIASGGAATLSFQMWIGAVNTPFTDVLNVRVDGTIVQSFPEPR